MKKERPILYSTPMVIAVKEDRKTKTRRLKGLEKINSDSRKWVYSHNSIDGHVPHRAIKYNIAPWYLFHPENTNGESWVVQCPYGQPGDILWVRETWAETTNIENLSPWPNRPNIMTENGADGSYQSAIIYRADGEWQWLDPDGSETEKSSWKPSIHMKKIYSRIWLEIISVKVERVQNISTQDIMSEGTPDSKNDFEFGRHKNYAIHCWEKLWSSINGKESWEANPWVWVIEFKRIVKE